MVERGGGPGRDRLMVRMPGDAVRTEGQHRVRHHLLDQAAVTRTVSSGGRQVAAINEADRTVCEQGSVEVEVPMSSESGETPRATPAIPNVAEVKLTAMAGVAARQTTAANKPSRAFRKSVPS